MTEFLENLSGLLSQNLWLGLLIALLAGLLTEFTPCCLSSIPLVIGFVSGYTDNRKKAFYYSLMFCIGMAVTLTAIGTAAALLGRLLGGAGGWWYLILGLLMAVMALQSWEVINILPQSCGYSMSKKKGTIGALLLGALGAIFSSPCATPVLVAILAVVSTGQSIVMGVLMLLLYSAGHSVLILIAGTSVGFAAELSKSKKFEKAGKIIKIVMGAVLFALSLYLVYIGFSGIF